MCPFRISSLITENTFLFMPTSTSNKSWRALEHFAALEAAVFGSATRKRTLVSCPRAPYWSTNCAGTYGQKEWDSWHLKILWQIHGFDKFMGQSSFHHPRKAHILRKLGPPPSYDLSLLYNVTGITARQTSRDWSANFLNSPHSNQAVWICLISFKIFSSIKLQGEEPKLGRNAKVIVRMSQVMNPLMLLPLKSSGHASGREVLAWTRAFKCYHLFMMSASCHHRVTCIIWTGLNQESLPPRHHSVQFQH